MTSQTKLEDGNGFSVASLSPESILEGSYIRVIPKGDQCGSVTVLLSPGIINANLEQFFIAVMLDGKLTDWEFNMLNRKRLEEERAE